jgi:hypothetical protein
MIGVDCLEPFRRGLGLVGKTKTHPLERFLLFFLTTDYDKISVSQSVSLSVCVCVCVCACVCVCVRLCVRVSQFIPFDFHLIARCFSHYHLENTQRIQTHNMNNTT